MTTAAKISPVKPRSHYRHYSNPECQGTLMQQSDNWPKGKVSRSTRMMDSGYPCDIEEQRSPASVPDGLLIDSAYADRMQEWDYEKYREASKLLNRGFGSPPPVLIEFAKAYFGEDVVAVRTVYYFNVATGYDCPVIQFLYRPKEAQS